MSRLIRMMALLVFAGAPFAAATAQDISRDDMRSLDGQVQEIKSDVLSIASELGNLEERLLYPSNTQVALFVAIEDDDDFRLVKTFFNISYQYVERTARGLHHHLELRY